MFALILTLFISLAPTPVAQVEILDAEVDALWAPAGLQVIVAIPANPGERGFENPGEEG